MSLLRRLLSRSFRWLIAAIWFLCRIAIIAWATLAIYYSNLPWAELRLGLAVIFAAFVDLGSLVFAPTKHARVRDRAASGGGRMVALHPTLT